MALPAVPVHELHSISEYVEHSTFDRENYVVIFVPPDSLGDKFFQQRDCVLVLRR